MTDEIYRGKEEIGRPPQATRGNADSTRANLPTCARGKRHAPSLALAATFVYYLARGAVAALILVGVTFPIAVWLLR